MALGAYTHTHIHTCIHAHTHMLWQNESDYKKPGARRPHAPGLKRGYLMPNEFASMESFIQIRITKTLQKQSGGQKWVTISAVRHFLRI